jgi:hypothetical protein
LGGHASGVEATARAGRALVLVLDGLRSAENVGNLFRTAEVRAAGWTLLHSLFCNFARFQLLVNFVSSNQSSRPPGAAW